jgi:hypothetical protein
MLQVGAPTVCSTTECGDLTSPSWRLGGWLRRGVSSATVFNRSYLDTRLR